ncbi:MAG: HDIG domain-containing protein [Mucinivorans sp.]
MKKILLVLLSAVTITVLIPHRGLVEMTASRGEVWNGATLVAPFDIPIAKAQELIQQQQEEVISNFEPVFRQDTSMVPLVDSAQRRYYLCGILSQSDRLAYQGKVIRVVLGTKVRSVPVENLEVEMVSRKPNLIFDAILTTKLRNEELNNISLNRGLVREGEVVVAKGQVVDSEVQMVLSSLKAQYESRVGTGVSRAWVLLGRFGLVLMLLSINVLYFSRFAKFYFGHGMRQLIFVFMLYVLMSSLVSITMRVDGLSPYLVPLPVVAIYLMTFFNMRAAILGNLSIALLGALAVKVPFDFFVLNFMAGMVAIFMLQHLYHRTAFFKAVGVIFVVEILMVVCFVLMRDASFSMASLRNFVWLLVNNFLVLGFYQAIFLIEKSFGFVSEVTYLELSDTNHQLLLRLAQEAPGTFQHSVQVANLAEGAALEIGANALQARCGALYHDIGKVENPFYFIENLSGTFNPHDDLSPIESARLVRAHVTDGLAIAQKHNIPRQVQEFIASHHGTSQIYFFLVKQRALGVPFDESFFEYPGPKPVSREVSICMMADSVEAASRSLPSYEREALDNLVDTIIQTQIDNGQLDSSELTFEEVGRIKNLFKSKLSNIYHARIAYPVRH